MVWTERYLYITRVYIRRVADKALFCKSLFSLNCNRLKQWGNVKERKREVFRLSRAPQQMMRCANNRDAFDFSIELYTITVSQYTFFS
jgi:hypothetical protein